MSLLCGAVSEVGEVERREMPAETRKLIEITVLILV